MSALVLELAHFFYLYKPRLFVTRSVFISLLFLVTGFLFGGVSLASDNGRVLMLGNSFTGYTHGAIPDKTDFSVRWFGGWNLEQHLNDSLSRDFVCRKAGFLVLQDSSVRPKNRDLFAQDIAATVELARACKLTPVLFMTWETVDIGFPTVLEAHNEEAAKHEIQVLPIGLVWNKLRGISESFYQSMLQVDGKHPTIRGANISAACVLKAFCQSCYESFVWIGFSPAEIELVTRIIDETVEPLKRERLSLAATINTILLLLDP